MQHEVTYHTYLYFIHFLSRYLSISTLQFALLKYFSVFLGFLID